MIIESLFPTPIGFYNYSGEYEKEYLSNQDRYKNIGNLSGVDRNILEKENLIDLRKFIEDSLHEYVMSTICPKYDTYLRITQSWLNWTEQGQFHHMHNHPNSLISGVFYVNANKEADKIYFYKSEYSQIQISPAEWNIYNSARWWFSVGSGDLILFPSSLMHSVETVSGNETRISIAFNTFPVGHLGEEAGLTYVKIGK